MTRSLANFSSWLLGAFKYLSVLIVNCGVDVINATILTIASISHLLLQVFPTTTVDLRPSAELIAMAGHINWFIPMSSISGAIALICGSYVVFFTIRPVVKFLHLA